ncbi:fimbrial protein [Providencia rettgeri]|uniref:fimbrial protein n=1 Tax=Providencia rettgeri TaxID=587 RepID=UPI001CFE59C2|nr:fimbrial protein [Providencia rettgeri]MCB4843388.1 fimbrial protein [Providencia rettgeri]
MNKKLISLIVVTSFTSLFSVSALSAPVANLKVSGDIKPPTCTVNGEMLSDINFNHGSISPTVIPESSEYALDFKSQKMVINCDASTYLTFKATNVYERDTYPSGFYLSRESTIFSLVDNKDIQKVIGGVAFNISQPKVDNVSVGFSRGNDGVDTNASFGGAYRLLKGATMGWTREVINNIDPSSMDLVPGKQFSAYLIVDSAVSSGIPNSYILSKKQLADTGVDLSEGVDFVGQAILTFNFGI